MNIIELIIDENDEFSGIDAISIVEAPAIEEHFVALNDHKEYKFAEVSKDQQILIGPMLIPNKPIYRREGDKEFYIYFTKDTVRKASELFLMKGKQNNSTYEHFEKLNGLSMVESWIVEDSEKDKSAFYGMTLPVGTWAGTIKVNNTEIWEQFVKTGKVKGFSIEGYFAEKGERPNEQIEEELAAAYKLLEIKQALLEYQLQSYSNYPSGVKNNAKRGIELNENQGNKCATQTGKVRAQQLAQGKAISLDTIKRMYSYLSRAEEYYDPNDTTACGTISYLLWGGKAGLRWSRSILSDLGEIDLVEKEILKAPCWDGYEMVGYKTKNGNKVPNCVPLSRKELKVGVPHYTADGKLWTGPTHKDADGRLMTGETHTEDSEYLYHKDELAEIGPRGGVKKSPKAPKSDTPNKNPKGEGTAKGDASGKSGAKVSEKDEATLQKKSDEFNEKYKEKLGYGVTVGMLKSVFQRGLGAFNTSSSPNVSSASQWAQARVNAFLYLVKNGRPENAKYTTDYDLLPTKHPKA